MDCDARRRHRHASFDGEAPTTAVGPATSTTAAASAAAWPSGSPPPASIAIVIGLSWHPGKDDSTARKPEPVDRQRRDREHRQAAHDRPRRRGGEPGEDRPPGRPGPRRPGADGHQGRGLLRQHAGVPRRLGPHRAGARPLLPSRRSRPTSPSPTASCAATTARSSDRFRPIGAVCIAASRPAAGGYLRYMARRWSPSGFAGLGADGGRRWPPAGWPAVAATGPRRPRPPPGSPAAAPAEPASTTASTDAALHLLRRHRRRPGRRRCARPVSSPTCGSAPTAATSG